MNKWKPSDPYLSCGEIIFGIIIIAIISLIIYLNTIK
jgi:hypothetical protein